MVQEQQDTNSKKRVIFVDNDAAFLEELKSLLNFSESAWDIQYAISGEQALSAMETAPPDVVVADLDMQDFPAVDFLKRVRELHPRAVRFTLTTSDQHPSMALATTVAHQFLHKPCDPHEFQVLIARACALRERLTGSTLKEKLHDVDGLPSLPSLYQRIMTEIHSSDPSIAVIGEIIEQDIGMSAKLLQIVNSAGIGLQHEVSNVVQAASLLGLQKVSSMALMIEVFSVVAGAKLPSGFSVDALWNHSLKVGEFATAIAKSEVDDSKLIDDSFTAGMLHDLGLVVFASRLPNELSQALDNARDTGTTLFAAEKALFNGTHAEAGGYLLELWGLPDAIVEAVTYHDYPSGLPEEDYPSNLSEHCFTPLIAVHIANYFCEEERKAEFGAAESELDTFFLERLGLTEKIETWWDACHETVA